MEKMVIVNRWAGYVYGGNEGWDGKYNTQRYPDGIYAYYIRVRNIRAGSNKVLKGTLILLR